MKRCVELNGELSRFQLSFNVDMGDNGADSSDCFCELCSLDFTTNRVSARFACLMHELCFFSLFFHASIY